MTKTLALLHFYKSIFGFPLIVSFAPILMQEAFPFMAMLIIKIFLFGIIWFFKYVDDREDKTYYFYYNQGLTKLHLFSFSLLIDMSIATLINSFV